MIYVLTFREKASIFQKVHRKPYSFLFHKSIENKGFEVAAGSPCRFRRRLSTLSGTSAFRSSSIELNCAMRMLALLSSRVYDLESSSLNCTSTQLRHQIHFPLPSHYFASSGSSLRMMPHTSARICNFEDRTVKVFNRVMKYWIKKKRYKSDGLCWSLLMRHMEIRQRAACTVQWFRATLQRRKKQKHFFCRCNFTIDTI